MDTQNCYFKVHSTVSAVVARINCVCERVQLIPGTVGRVMNILSFNEAKIFLAEGEDPLVVRIANAGDFIVSTRGLQDYSIRLSNAEYQTIRRGTHKS